MNESVSDRVTHWAVRWWLKIFDLNWDERFLECWPCFSICGNLWKILKYKKSKITKNEEYKSHEWWALNTFGRINIFKIGEHFQNRWTFSKEVNGGGGGWSWLRVCKCANVDHYNGGATATFVCKNLLLYKMYLCKWQKVFVQIRLKHYYPKCRGFCARLARRGIWLEKNPLHLSKFLRFKPRLGKPSFFKILYWFLRGQ